MGYRSKSVSLQVLLALAIIAAVAFVPSTISAGKTYTVGGPKGWTDDECNYKSWASGKTFYVGDKLVFKYKHGEHNVYQVNKSQYQNCGKPNDESKGFQSGHDTITLKSTGTKYFICGVPYHCGKGQKLAVNVVKKNY